MFGNSPQGRHLGELRRYIDDPYRVARRGDSGTDFDEIISVSPGSDIAHSRSASDSSTRKLTSTPTPIPIRDYYEDDPYARPINSDTKRNSKLGYLERITERANSYLPYSHHQRDPNAPITPIYIEDTPSVIGASDKDRTISIQPELNNNNNNNNQNHHDGATPSMTARVMGGYTTSPLTGAEGDQIEFSKRKTRRRWCGLRKRIITFFIFLFCAAIALIWYFVWPRVPQLMFEDVDGPSYYHVNNNDTQQVYFNASWILNMTADNNANWIPTHIRDMAVTVFYRPTNQPFGHGNSGSFQLSPRSFQIVEIPISIYILVDSNDPTYVAVANACGPRDNAPSLPTTENSFNIDFLVDISISGIAWSTTKNVSVPQGFACPLV
ncbi:hypothetical protein BDA99DRAFT_535903 [Phascolomyces articulosus]|uniref:Uncharacterized protein n=1 Tax=Phascolomyces articulosus TaxID=60185 RepID=A0AAD5K2F1_9FUNG|nr:hypothetical protein BDA99DRAFT_535903 [Phascolomyces articulosus]